MKFTNLSLRKLIREARRLFQKKKNRPSFTYNKIRREPTEFQPDPLLVCPWTGAIHDQLDLAGLPGLKPRHRAAFNIASKYIDFRDKTILEVGGSTLPRDLLFDVLGVRKWIHIDFFGWQWQANRKNILTDSGKIVYPLNHPDSKKIISDNNHVVFDGSASEIGEELYDEFDACISIAAFEHIIELRKTVTGIYRALKNDGVFFTLFGPLWSCKYGHHLDINKEYCFKRIQEIHLPPYAHLLYSASEIDELLSPYYKQPEEILIKNQIVKGCTDESSSNHLFYEDFIEIMQSSLFENISFAPELQSVVDSGDWFRLCRRYPKYRSFSVISMQIAAKKQKRLNPVPG